MMDENGPSDCICGRGDWIYDNDVGMWCCGCLFVRRDTGKGFKDGTYSLDKNRKLIINKPVDILR